MNTAFINPEIYIVSYSIIRLPPYYSHSFLTTVSQRFHCIVLCDLTTNQFIPGWGKIKHPGGSHNILQQAQMPPVTNAACAKKLALSPGKLILF